MHRLDVGSACAANLLPCVGHVLDALKCDYVRLRKFEALEVAVSTHYMSNVMGLPGSKPAIPSDP